MENVRLESLISEYRSTLDSREIDEAKSVDRESLLRLLCKNHDWTDGGARAIVHLANDYGAFMLRSALALAVVLRKEDGDLNY